MIKQLQDDTLSSAQAMREMNTAIRQLVTQTIPKGLQGPQGPPGLPGPQGPQGRSFSDDHDIMRIEQCVKLLMVVMSEIADDEVLTRMMMHDDADVRKWAAIESKRRYDNEPHN